MLSPGSTRWRVVEAIAFAKTTVLQHDINLVDTMAQKHIRTCLPMLVRPRASLLLWTGLQIQLILGSRVICMPNCQIDPEEGVPNISLQPCDWGRLK